jgi:hypothetical protein
MKINDGLPMLCDTLGCRLQPFSKGAGAISRGRQGPLLFQPLERSHSVDRVVATARRRMEDSVEGDGS